MRKLLKITAFLLIALTLASPNLSAQVGSSKVVSTKKVDAKKVVKQKKIFAPVDKRWENSIRLLYEDLISVGIHYDGMYRVNKAFGIGIGTGYNYVFQSLHSSMYHRVPLYAIARVYLIGEKKVNPFFGFAQGIDVGFYKIQTSHHDGFDPGAQTPDHIVGEWMFIGSHSRIEFGLNFRLNASKSVFFSIEAGVSACPDKYYVEPENIWFGAHQYEPAFGVNLGFTF